MKGTEDGLSSKQHLSSSSCESGLDNPTSPTAEQPSPQSPPQTTGPFNIQEEHYARMIVASNPIQQSGNPIISTHSALFAPRVASPTDSSSLPWLPNPMMHSVTFPGSTLQPHPRAGPISPFFTGGPAQSPAGPAMPHFSHFYPYPPNFPILNAAAVSAFMKPPRPSTNFPYQPYGLPLSPPFQRPSVGLNDHPLLGRVPPLDLHAQTHTASSGQSKISPIMNPTTATSLLRSGLASQMGPGSTAFKVYEHNRFRNSQTAQQSFTKGTLIHLASGQLREVENLQSSDFIQSVERHPDQRVEVCTVHRIEKNHAEDRATIEFSVGKDRKQVMHETNMTHPFFVLDHGWASCDPERSFDLYRLSRRALQVGDQCIVRIQKRSHGPEDFLKTANETANTHSLWSRHKGGAFEALMSQGQRRSAAGHLHHHHPYMRPSQPRKSDSSGRSGSPTADAVAVSRLTHSTSPTNTEEDFGGNKNN